MKATALLAHRTAARLVALGIAAGMLAGCGKRPAEAPVSTATPGAAPTAAASRDGTDASLSQFRANLCSDTNASGVGLRGEYFARADWQGPAIATRTDPTLDFVPSSNWPPAGQNGRAGSVRWTGWVKALVPGRYKFELEGAPDARITVAREQVFGPAVSGEKSVELPPGRYSPIVVELASLANTNGPVRLLWTTPYGVRFVVPRALLYMPSDTVAPASAPTR